MTKKELHVWKTHQVFESMQISQIWTEIHDEEQTHCNGDHQPSSFAQPKLLAVSQLIQNMDSSK